MRRGPVGSSVPGRKERAPASSFRGAQLGLTISFSKGEHTRALGRKSDREEDFFFWRRILAPVHINENWPTEDIPSSAIWLSHRSKFKIYSVFFFYTLCLSHPLLLSTLFTDPMSWGATTIQKGCLTSWAGTVHALSSSLKWFWLHSLAPSKFHLPNIKLFSASCALSLCL